MIWIAPSKMDTDRVALGKRRRDAAEEAVPAPQIAETDFNGTRPEVLLGLIFLRFAEIRSAAQGAKLKAESNVAGQINHH
jgi:hypothetical protein